MIKSYYSLGFHNIKVPLQVAKLLLGRCVVGMSSHQMMGALLGNDSFFFSKELKEIKLSSYLQSLLAPDGFIYRPALMHRARPAIREG